MKQLFLAASLLSLAACGQQAGRAAQRRHLPGVVRGLQSAGEGRRRPLTQVQPGMPLPQGLSSVSRSLGSSRSCCPPSSTMRAQPCCGRVRRSRC